MIVFEYEFVVGCLCLVVSELILLKWLEVFVVKVGEEFLDFDFVVEVCDFFEEVVDELNEMDVFGVVFLVEVLDVEVVGEEVLWGEVVFLEFVLSDEEVVVFEVFVDVSEGLIGEVVMVV